MKSLVVVLVLVVFLVGGCGSGGSGSDSDYLLPPFLTYMDPFNQDFAPINTSVVFSFTDDMDPTTVSTETVSLKNGSVSVAGTIKASAYDKGAFVFIPTGWLASNTGYTFHVSTGVKNSNGISMQNDYTSYFSTGTTIDSIPPTVIATHPEADATGLWLTVEGNITATFSEKLDITSFDESSFQLYNGGVEVPCVATYDVSYLTVGYYCWEDPLITPSLNSGATYTATVSGAVRDLAGNAMGKDYAWTFSIQDDPAK